MKKYIKSSGVINYNSKFNLDIDSITKYASDDYEVTYKVFKVLLSECDLLNIKLKNINDIRNTKLREKIVDLKTEYQRELLAVLTNLNETLIKKKLACQGITLALMGRTKAGKSTLHSIMCNEGDEFIGKGGQRTTRFNRVFSWNGIKIVDTPGIGAGESDGINDEKIARSVISGSDIICFVIADDTISEDILKLLDSIASSQKPMIILLNHKDDIGKNSHQKRFLRNPTAWKDTSNEKNLDGWMQRIRRNAEHNHYGEMVRIVPVFLLATKMGQEEKNIFYDNSNYDEFVNSIKDMVENNCYICKSQNMNDEPAIQLHNLLKVFEEECFEIDAYKEKVKNIGNKFEKKMKYYKNHLLSDCNNIIARRFDDFYASKCDEYIESNYTEKSVFKLQTNYEDMRNKYDLYSDVREELNDIFEQYHKDINQIVSDIEEEFKYAAINTMEERKKMETENLKMNKDLIPIKGILKFVSMGLDVVSIWCPALMIISVPLSWGSGLLKSKSEKEQISKNLTHENFKKLINYDREQYIKKLDASLIDSLTKDENSIQGIFDNLVTSLSDVSDYYNNCKQRFEKGVKKLDKYFAYRIMQYLGGEEDVDWNDEIIDVKRDLDAKSITIVTKHSFYYDTKELFKITGEKIRIRMRR